MVKLNFVRDQIKSILKWMTNLDAGIFVRYQNESSLLFITVIEGCSN